MRVSCGSVSGWSGPAYAVGLLVNPQRSPVDQYNCTRNHVLRYQGKVPYVDAKYSTGCTIS